MVPAAPPDAVEAQHPAATVAARLDGLRQALLKARDGITQSLAGTSDPVFDLALADIEQAQSDVAGARTYLLEHPEENALTAGHPAIAAPGLRPYSSGAVQVLNRMTSSPALATAFVAVPDGLNQFLSGADPLDPYIWVVGIDHKGGGVARPGTGPVVGPIDGFRDKIIHDVGIAAVHLAEAARKFINATGPNTQAKAAPNSPVASPLGATGSISGVMLDSVGDPAANVLVSVGPADARTGQAANMPAPMVTARLIAGAIPATISDEHGVFTIRDLPAGRYIVTGTLGGVRGDWYLLGPPPRGAAAADNFLVELKSGEEVKMTGPLRLQ